MEIKNLNVLKKSIKEAQEKPTSYISVFSTYTRMIIFGAIIALIGIIVYLITITGLIHTQPEVTVPSVISKNYLDASRILQDAGLTWNVEEEYNKFDKFTVTKQEPQAGTVVKQGRTVILYVSAGRIKRSVSSTNEIKIKQTYVIRFDVPNTVDPGATITIKVTDARNITYTVLNASKYPGETFITNFVGYGPLTQKVYINDEIFKEVGLD